MALSFVDTTTLAALGTSTIETFSDNNGKVDSGTLETLLTTSVTTATSSIGPDVNIRLDATRDYVSSMSVQEIDQMLIELDNQEKEIVLMVDEPVKVKTIGSKTKF